MNIHAQCVYTLSDIYCLYLTKLLKEINGISTIIEKSEREHFTYLIRHHDIPKSVSGLMQRVYSCCMVLYSVHNRIVDQFMVVA